MATPMTLEGCAEMRAEMDAGQLRDDVLARAGVSVDEWVVAQREWLDKMGMDLERERFELTNRYTRAFLDRQRALKAAKPPPPREAAPGKRAETMLPDASAQTSEMAPWRGRVPSADGPTALPFTPAGPPHIASGVSISSTPIAAPFFPEAWPQRKPVEEAVTETAPMPPLRIPSDATATAGLEPAWASSTSWLQPSPILRAPLPFQVAPPTPAAVAAPPPRSPNVSTVHAEVVPVTPDAIAGTSPDPPEWATSTTGLGPSVLRAALPFQPAPTAPASTPAARPTSLTSSTASVQSPVGAFRSELTLNRAQQPAPARVNPVPASPPPLPAPRLPAPTQSQPAQSAPPVRTTWTLVDSGLSLEQHASLCVELAVNPSRTEEVLNRYRVTAERKAELDLLWKARFSADPAIEVRWREAYRLYSDFLATRRS